MKLSHLVAAVIVASTLVACVADGTDPIVDVPEKPDAPAVIRRGRTIGMAMKDGEWFCTVGPSKGERCRGESGGGRELAACEELCVETRG